MLVQFTRLLSDVNYKAGVKSISFIAYRYHASITLLARQYHTWKYHIIY